MSNGADNTVSVSIASAFDQFWKIYPRKTEKLHAKKMFARALQHTTVDRILSAVQIYADQRRGEDPQYTKHPGTWLNRGCWDDEAPAPPAEQEPIWMKPPAEYLERQRNGNSNHAPELRVVGGTALSAQVAGTQGAAPDDQAWNP